MARKKSTVDDASSELADGAEEAASLSYTVPDEEPDELLEQAKSVAVETLTGDVRDFILDRLRYEQDKRPWHERSESEQRETIHRVESSVHDVVQRAVELIAAQGRRSIKATLEQITIKDGIKATITLSKFDTERHKLFDAQGSKVLIVVADPDDFVGERAPAPVKLDQGTLPVEAAVVHADTDREVPFH